MRHKFLLLIKLGCIAVGVAIVLSFFNSLHPAFDTIANFRIHFAWLCLAALLFWILAKAYKNAAIMLFLGIASAASAASGIYNPYAQETSDNPAAYSLIHFNVRFDNNKRSEVVDMILREDPDIFTGVEMNYYWFNEIKRLLQKYPYALNCPVETYRGGAYIFSKFEFTNKQKYCHHFASLGVNEVVIEDTPISIGVVHLRWPWPASQPKQLKEMTPFLKTLNENALIIGDFNAGTWTQAIKTFAREGSLNIVPGIGGTWTLEGWLSFLAPIFGLPIDNLLHKGAMNVLSAKSMKTIGSDHLPIKVIFTIDK